MWQTAIRRANDLWRPKAFSGLRFGLMCLIGVIGLAACQSRTAPPTPTPIVYTATSPPVSATPAPTSFPAVFPIGLDNPHRAAFRLLNTLNQMPVDVYLEQTLIGSALAYGLPTSPTAFAPGSYTLRIFHTGDSPTAANVKFSQSIKLPDGLSGLMVITGTPDKPTITLLANDVSSIPAGQIRLSVAAFGADSAFPVNVTADQQPITSLTSPGTLAKSALQPATLQSVTFSPQKGDPVKSSGAFSERQAYLVVLLASADPAVQSSVIVIGDDSQRTAQIRVINASPDLTAATVKLNDQSVTSALALGQATDWQTVPAGNSFSLSVSGIQAAPTVIPATIVAVGTAAATQSTTQVVPTMSASNTPAPRLATTLDLPTDARLDLILYGPASALQVQVLAEDFSPIANGQARLELFNAAPGTDGVLPFTEGSPLSTFTGVDYGQTTGPVLIPPGSLATQFRMGDTSGAFQVVEFKAPFTYNADTAYLYVLTGSAAPTPLVLDTPVQTSATPIAGATATPSGALQFRLLNAMSDGTAVNVSLNGLPVFSNVAAGQGTAYQSIGAQFATWTLTASGAAQTPLAKTDLIQIGQGTVTLVAVGTASAARFFQVVDKIPPGVSDALLDVIHAAPNASTLRVEAQSTSATAQTTATPSESFVEPGLTSAPEAVTEVATQSAAATSTSGPLTATPFGAMVQPTPITTLLPPTSIQPNLVIADRLEYSGISTLQAIPSGTFTLIVRDNATGTPIGQSNSLTIAPGQRYDLLVLPGGSSGSLKIVAVTSNLPNPVSSP